MGTGPLQVRKQVLLWRLGDPAGFGQGLLQLGNAGRDPCSIRDADAARVTLPSWFHP
jgi:hypothetical protein